MERSSPSDPDVANTFAQLQAALADRYALERELGQGGMATVYLARDLRHGRPVAIKVLRPEIAAALVADVPGEVDRGHPAAAELALDRVAVRQRSLQLGERVRHGRPGGHRLHERRPTLRSSC